MLASWRRCAFALVAATGVLAAASSPALAADLEKKWEVGVAVARSFYDNDSTLADDFATSVRGGYHFHTNHAVEISFQVQSTQSNTRGSDLEYDVRRWALNYLYNFKPKKQDSKLAPLILFGVGNMYWDSGDDSEGSTLFQTGGGVRVLFTSWMALRVEGRLFRFYGSDLIPRDSFYAFDADIGLSFFFGG